jgi:hypothetical protein
VDPVIVTEGERAQHQERDEIIEGLILDEGLYFLVGEPDSLKTMLALQLAACVGHGLRFLGQHTTRTRVLYSGFEGTPAGWPSASGPR